MLKKFSSSVRITRKAIDMNFFDYFIRYYYRHEFGVTFILTEVVCCLAIALIFEDVRVKEWKTWLRLLIDWVVTFVVYILLSCLVYYIYEVCGNVENSGNSRFYVWLSISFIHIIILKSSFKNVLLGMTNGMACSLFILLSINLSGALGSWFTSNNGAPTSLWNDMTLYLVFVLLILAVILFKYISPFKYRYVNNLSIVLVNLTFIVCYATEIMGSILMDKTNAFFWIMTLSIWLISILAYVSLYINVKNYNLTLDIQAKAMKSESERNQMMLSKSQYEELHRIRHDIKNQMMTLENLFRSQNFEKLNEYFSDLDENVHITIDYVDSSNEIVDAIMNGCLAKCKANNLRLTHRISVPPSLGIKSDNLNSLISNLIDNAIEYETSHDLYDTPIEFSMYYDEGHLLVTCKNALTPDEDEEGICDLKSRKNDSNHGYGVKIIKSIVNEYHGVYKYFIEDHMMIFEAMLEMEEENL